MRWLTGTHDFDLDHKGVIMGILNTTPDSFSDGGRFQQIDAAIEHAGRMVEEGADIIDVGGESTRPGASPVPLDEELARTIPVVTQIAKTFPQTAVSIDTTKAEVAHRAIDAGAGIINDISAMRADPDMTELARRSGAGVVLMHMQGTPKTMQNAPDYRDVVAEVVDFLRQRLAECATLGIETERMALDPGIGFGKTVDHNVRLLKGTPALAALGRPVLLGVSRKSFLARLVGSEDVGDRYWPTVALTARTRSLGARIFRVHDVQPNRYAMVTTEAIMEARANG